MRFSLLGMEVLRFLIHRHSGVRDLALMLHMNHMEMCKLCENKKTVPLTFKHGHYLAPRWLIESTANELFMEAQCLFKHLIIASAVLQPAPWCQEEGLSGHVLL